MAPAMAIVAAPLVSCRCSAPCMDPAASPAPSNADAVRGGMRSSCSTSTSLLSRRGLVSAGATAMAVALGMRLQQEEVAMARDIPLFGIRKRAEKLEKEVVKEVKELVKEGEKEVKELVKEGQKEVKELVKEGEKEATVVAEAVFPSKRDNREESQSFSPALQAGAVVAAELVGVAVAATVVNGVIGQPSK